MNTSRFRAIASKFSPHFKRLYRLWQKAVEPPPSIKDPQIRQRARLFNGLLVMIIPVTFFALFIQIWQSPIQEITTSPTIRAVIVGIVVVIACNLLNRIIPSYRWMAYTWFALGFMVILAVAFSSKPPHLEILFLIFLPLVSTILFSLRGTFTLCCLTLIGTVIFGKFMPDLPADVLKNMLVFMVLAQIFILFVAQQRNHLEQDRQHLALEETRNKLLKSLITNLSHDFRTPLSIINVNAYLAERIADRERRNEKISVIGEQTMRLNKLLDDILTISRLEHASTSSRELCEVNALLRQIIERAQPKAAQKSLRIFSEFAPNTLPVHANRDDLCRVFANVIENAIDYTASGGSVTVRTRSTASMTVTEIIDTGIGIDPSDLPLVFDLFFRGDRARSADTGVGGLGLSIARRVVEMHQGSITIESEPEKGSTFRIALPFAPPPA